MGKLNKNLNVDDLIFEMSEGNPGALSFILEMMKTNEEAVQNIIFFDTMEIYGEKLYMFWNDCCSRNQEKVNATIAYLRKESVSKEKIHENLSQCYAKPFI